MNDSVAVAKHPVCSHQAILYLIVQIITILLNFIVVIVLTKLKGYKGNTNHLVVRVLVLSDAIGATTTLTPISMSCLGYRLQESTACQAFGFLSNVILLWTVLIVLLMCTLRYFAVVRPLFYRTYITYSLTKWLLLGLLLWSSVHIVLPLFGVGRFKFYPTGQYCSFEIPPRSREDFALVHLIVWEGWLLIIVLIFCTMRMVRELRIKKKLQSRLSFQQRRGVEANRMRQRGYTVMTVVIVAIFLVCYIPFLTYRAMTLVKKHVDESFHFHLHLLAHLNPMLNPILYVSCNRGYKSAVRAMFGKMFSCFAEPVRRVSMSNSICMSLFSDDGVAARSERARTSLTTNFLEVPGVRDRAKTTPTEEKPLKRRRGKRNSIDVTAIGSPTRGLKGLRGDTLSPARREPRIEETASRETFPTNYMLSNTTPSSLSSSFTSPCHASPCHPLETELETKPRGLSVSSIVYAVDNLIVQRNVSPLPSFVIINDGCEERTTIEEITNDIGSPNEFGDDDVFST